eukprot:TRINITY_DN22551_c0_g1_i1.p1 TRINITY_DN22551_c0_g1~~TRINITY_DN22551_c0_g1_i1.p1  ORF type:complete len:213 (+),score=96.40 TRINITY_DN22551_c0_g1_i1:34-672(+)
MFANVFFFQAEDGIRDLVRSRGLGDVYKRQEQAGSKIKKGWTDSDTTLLVALVHQHQHHKNKWKLVAAAMPDARTPGQVKEKYHRMQKLPEFGCLAAKFVQSSRGAHNTPRSPTAQPSSSPDKPEDSDNALKLMTSAKSASGFRGVSRAGSRWEAYIGNGTAGKRYIGRFDTPKEAAIAYARACLLYTSDAADDLLCVDLGGRRLIKKKRTM